MSKHPLRSSVAVLVAALIVLLSGCSSKSEWLTPGDFSYTEQVQGFFVSEDKSTLLVIGQTYSYLFEIEGPLAEVLLLSRYVEFDNQVSKFRIDKAGSVSGTFRLYADPALLNSSEEQLLKRVGYRRMKSSRYSSGEVLKVSVEMSGRVISPEDGSSFVTYEWLQTPISVQVEAQTAELDSSTNEIVELVKFVPTATGLIIVYGGATMVMFPVAMMEEWGWIPDG